jgi:hypothetical protein
LKNLPSPLVFRSKSAFLTLLEATMPFPWLESIARMNIGTLRPLVIAPAADHLGHRQLPLAAIDATTGGAEHQVVPGGGPACLLRFTCA